mmetsp:Transcript_42487/g.106195  ORF Transcript_42487/g.106195 Transcript_42487/m.106195 type:complete len:118 (+) Transcript_42487:77-430(+)
MDFLWRLFVSKIKRNGKGLIDFDRMKVDSLVVAAYTSVLIGCAIKESSANKYALLEVPGWNVVPLIQVLDYFIVCHEEADQGRTVTEDFIGSLTEVLSLLKELLESGHGGDTGNIRA